AYTPHSEDPPGGEAEIRHVFLALKGIGAIAGRPVSGLQRDGSGLLLRRGKFAKPAITGLEDRPEDASARLVPTTPELAHSVACAVLAGSQSQANRARSFPLHVPFLPRTAMGHSP